MIPAMNFNFSSRPYLGSNFQSCLKTKGINRLRCGVATNPVEVLSSSAQLRSDAVLLPSRWKWESMKVDRNLQTFVTGGLDREDVYWPGKADGRTPQRALQNFDWPGEAVDKDRGLSVQPGESMKVSI